MKQQKLQRFWICSTCMARNRDEVRTSTMLAITRDKIFQIATANCTRCGKATRWNAVGLPIIYEDLEANLFIHRFSK